MHSIAVGPLAARHSFDAITRLLHRSYGPMADAGIDFSAATQTAEVTARRAAEGQCFVAEHEGEIVGTVTVCGPYAHGEAPWAAAVSWFRERDTAHFHQFAVHPSFRGQGLGQRLISACETWALQRGYRRMALDTPEPAADLQALYTRLGYAVVERMQWDGKAYSSFIMQKSLDRSPLRDHLQTLARYHLWATGGLFSHVDALPDEDYRRDNGLFFKSVHGSLNHLLVAEHQLWFRRFAEGVSPSVVLDAEVEPDRNRLRERLLEGARAWLPLIDRWTELRLQGNLEYQRINGQRVVLPFAATLAHVFNHGTHHRGQITAAITAMGRPGPSLDMVTMLQQESTTP